MKQNSANHLSVELNIDTSSRPIIFYDRIPASKMIKGVILSLIIMLVPLFIHFGSSSENIIIIEDSYNEPKNEAFFYIFSIIGCLFLIANLATFFQKRKIVIDDENITVHNTNLLNTNEAFVEPISNYIGVRFRGRIFKYGFFVKYQQVIELLHDDNSKTIPIYINKNTKDIRLRWQKIADDFNLPTVARTADGYKIMEAEDLQKPIKKLIIEEKIDHSFDEKQEVPKIFSINSEQNKKELVINKIISESGAFFVASVSIVMASILLITLFTSNFFNDCVLMSNVLKTFSTIIIITIPYFMFLRRQSLIFEADKIHIAFKLPFFSLVTNTFEKDNINAVDVIYREFEGAYYVAITSQDKTSHIGKGCNPVNLKWLNSFIIENIVNS